MPSPDRSVEAELAALAPLAEPIRRRLYLHVAAAPGAVSRDDAAAAVGIARSLAAFHLDRLVQDGLLETEYARRSGRTGPGAGRPAKLYRRSAADHAVSLPTRNYELPSQLFAAALDAGSPADAGTPADALARVRDEARAHGRALAARRRPEAAGGREPTAAPADMPAAALAAVSLDATRPAGSPRPGERAEPGERGAPGEPDASATPADRLEAVLAEEGYQPRLDDGVIRLGNCPFHALVAAHRDLTCGMNLALMTGLVEGLGASGWTPVLDPQPGLCCVAFRPTAAAGPVSRANRRP